MYKTRLQELCHRRSWELPQYSTTKTGLDHMPLFLTTVAVNGHSFVTPSPSRSSKLSQNDAARIAFDRLSPPDPTRPFPLGGASEMDLADLEKLQPSLQDDCMILEDDGTNQMVGDAVVHGLIRAKLEIADGEHLYKNQLQTYAQRKNLALPVYTCEREGPGHASRFRCKVEIYGKTFVSAEYFRSAKEAEHAAAKVALSSLSESNVKEGGFVLYKNLLQEFCQKHGYELPVYRTTRTGEVHAPTFASIVEISGENFTGQRGPTKKMAEMNAAKVAYTTLEERKANQNSITQHSVRRGQSSSFPYFAPQSVSNVSNLGGFVTETAGGSATGKVSQNSIPQHSVNQGQSSSFPYFAPQPVSNVSNLGGFVTETAGGLATGNLTKKPQVHEAASLKKFPQDLHELCPSKCLFFSCCGTPSQAAVLKSFGHHTWSSGVNRDRLVNSQKDSITEEVLTSGASPCWPKQATDMIEFMSNSGVATSGGVDTNPGKSPDENERVGDPFPHPSSSMPASTTASICSWSSDSSAPMPCGFPDMPPNVIRIYPRSVNLKFPENNIVLSNENWVALSRAPTNQSN